MGLAGFFHRNDKGEETPVAVENVVDDAGPGAKPPEPKAAAPSPELAQLQAKLDETNRRLEVEQKAREQERADRAAKDRAALAARIHADAGAFAAGQAKKIVPACEGPLATLHAHAALTAAGLPAARADGTPIDATAELEALCKALPDHNLAGESMASAAARGLAPLSNGSGGDGPTPERIAELLAQHPAGGPALAATVLKN